MTVGLRERQKTERRRRIEAAAREVFREKGYDAATTREIAARAEVSIGTLFAYAADKRELLTMVYRDELHELTETTFASVPAQAPPHAGGAHSSSQSPSASDAVRPRPLP